MFGGAIFGSPNMYSSNVGYIFSLPLIKKQYQQNDIEVPVFLPERGYIRCWTLLHIDQIQIAVLYKNSWSRFRFVEWCI